MLTKLLRDYRLDIERTARCNADIYEPTTPLKGYVLVRIPIWLALRLEAWHNRKEAARKAKAYVEVAKLQKQLEQEGYSIPEGLRCMCGCPWDGCPHMHPCKAQVCHYPKQQASR